MKTRSTALAPAFILLLLVSISALLAQQKTAPKPAPPPPPPPKPAAPPPKPASSQTNPLSNVGDTLKHDAAETAISTLLNNELPLKLDASAVYPTVNVLPGEPFQPKPLQLTANELNRPLPPGDYTIPMLTFCSEYSVHRPGYGTAYILGPMQGKAAGGIAALLWRGTLEKGRPPQQLQAVSWAIQSGLTYSQMPKTYQAVIDDVIPDHKNELNGDFIQSLEGVYQNYAKTMKLPPLDQQLAKMGKSGELALSAKRQREALLRQNTTDQIREQTLFQGQESGVYTPVKAEEGPWSVLVPNVMYARLKIVGGNLAANNVLEMRILPQSGPAVAWNHAPQFVLAGYRPVPEPPQLATTLAQWLQALWNAIGYPVGQGAQDLKPVLPPAPPSQCKLPCVGTVTELEGKVTITRGNTTVTLKPGDQVNMNDTIKTEAGSRAFILFADDTEFRLSENTKLTVDDYVFDSKDNATNKARYSLLEGAFQYVSGLIAKKHDPDERIETGFGTIGIRGTEFVAIMNSTDDAMEIDLIDGQLDITPKVAKRDTLFTAPVNIAVTAASATGAPLSQRQYEAAKVRLSPSQGAGVPVL